MTAFPALLLAVIAGTDSIRIANRELPAEGLRKVFLHHAHGDCFVYPAAPATSPHVELEIEASGLDAGQESRFLDAMDLRVESTAAGEILVESIFGDMDQKPAQLSFAARLRVWLPQEVSVDVENRFGAVEVAERGGGVTVQNRLGPVHVRDVTGNVEVRCDYGSIEVTDVRGDATLSGTERVAVIGVTGHVEVSNKFGEVQLFDVGSAGVENRNAPIEISRVEGAARVVAPYCRVLVQEVGDRLTVEGNNESVTVKGVGGDLDVTHRHGTLTLGGIGGNVTLRGHFSPTELRGVQGSVDVVATNSQLHVDGVQGSARLEGVTGAMEIRNVGGELRATGKGGLLLVVFETPLLPGEAPRSLDLENRAGPIELELPEGSSCTASVTSTLGALECEFPNFTRERSGRVSTGTLVLGAGEVGIRALAVDSSVRIRKHRPE